MSELVQVRALAKPFVLRGVKNSFHVLFEIQTGFLNPPSGADGAAAAAPAKRAPFNLAIVLDRSGSMSGRPFANSKVAVKKVINSMGDDDFLHLVAYDDNSKVVFFAGTRANRDVLLSKVDDLDVGGCTNMMAGVDDARQILKGEYVPREAVQERIVYVKREDVNAAVKEQVEAFDKTTLQGGRFAKGGEFYPTSGTPTVFGDGVETAEPVPVSDEEGEEEGEGEEEEDELVVPVNANRRIFLFTDGMVNRGIKNKDEIYRIIRSLHDEDHINVTSFGLGAEFDEELMMNIAENGRGDYFFISGADDIDPKVQKGMSVLQTLIGKNSKLTIEGCNGATVKKVYGFDGALAVPVGDLCEDDVRTVLVEMEMLLSTSGEAGPEADSDPLRCLTFEYSFEGIDEDAAPVTLAGDCCVVATEDGDKASVESDAVNVAKVIAHSSEIDMRIVRLLESSNIAKAVELKEQIVSELMSVEKVDTTGIIHLILVKARQTLKKLKNPAQIRIIQKGSVSLSPYRLSSLEVRYSSYQATIVHRKVGDRALLLQLTFFPSASEEGLDVTNNE